MDQKPRLLYCHCNYAQVVPPEVKSAVLRRICDSGLAFDAVADLCEMSARQDPTLRKLAEGHVKIAACFPRAVKWLFSAAHAPLNPDTTEVLNMREFDADRIMEGLERPTLEPNLPDGKASPPPPAEAPIPHHASVS